MDNIYNTIYNNLPKKYNKKIKNKIEFIKSENGKKEFTKTKNTIKENKQQKICPPIFCSNSHTPLIIDNLQSFLLRCGTRLYEWGTEWDSNLLVKVC